MASALDRKEIRRDPLVEWLKATVQFVRSHRTAMLVTLVLLAVGSGAGAAYWWYQTRQAAEARVALAAAEDAFRGNTAGGGGGPEEAVRRYQAVAERYPRTESAEEALIRLGNLHYENGKLDEALASFGEYVRRYPRGRFLIMAALGKAYAEEGKGDLQSAVQTLSSALERAKDAPLAGEVLTSLGRLYEHLRKPDDAIRIYGQVVDRFTGTYWANHALQRMSILKPN